MIFHCLLLLLTLCFLLGLAWLCHLGWSPHGHRHLAAKTAHPMVQRLLKPRTPIDCSACRLASTASSAGGPASLLVRPWREVKSRRGAPKRIPTDGYACPNPQCTYCGITDAHMHALVGDGKHGRTERIQTFRCQACRTTFSARRGARPDLAAERVFGFRQATITSASSAICTSCTSRTSSWCHQDRPTPVHCQSARSSSRPMITAPVLPSASPATRRETVPRAGKPGEDQ